MATHAVDTANFENDVLGADVPVVVDFWADWCGPCKAIAPSLEELSEEMADQVKIAKVDIVDNPDIATRYGIRNIPTLVLFKNGEPASVLTGGRPKSQLENWIKESI